MELTTPSVVRCIYGNPAGFLWWLMCSWNTVSFGIVFLGLFEPDKEHCREALKAAQLLFRYLVDNKRLVEHYTVYGIRQIRPFNFPCKELYDVIKTWPNWVSKIKQLHPLTDPSRVTLSTTVFAHEKIYETVCKHYYSLVIP